MNNKEITNFLIRIVKEASNIVSDNFTVENKGNNSDLVTTMDYEIETYIINEIKKEYPKFDTMKILAVSTIEELE